MKKIILLLVISAVLASFAYADVIIPGYRGIEIKNYIANINDYSDYVFFTAGEIGIGMCPVHVIGSDGEIPSMYKFCSPSVYAVKKSEFNLEHVKGMDDTGIKEYIYSSGVQKVLTHIQTYTDVPETSTEISRTEYHTITLEQVKEEPAKTVIERNYLFNVYIAAAVIALATIMFLVFKKKGMI